MTPSLLRHCLPAAGMALMLTACASAGSSQPRMADRIEGASVDVDSVAGDYLRGRFAARQRALEEAASAFSEAAASTDRTVLTDRAFQFALASGDLSAAHGYAEALLAQGPAPDGTDRGAIAFTQRDLPRLTLAAEALEGGDEDDALALLSEPFASSLGRALGFLVEAWAIYGRDGLDAAVIHLSDAPDETFLGFAPLHLALMYDLSGRRDAAEAGYAAALKGASPDMALIGFAGLLERQDKAEEALDLYHRMSEDRGYVRRVGRMGLARLGEPIDGETRSFRRAARRAPLRLVSDAREGAALAFLNFAWAAYEQAISEQEAAMRAGFGELDLFLNAPLSFAQIAASLDEDQGAAHYMIGAIAGAYDQPEMAAAANARVGPSSWLYNYAVIDRAEALVALERREEAIELLEDYVEQDALAPDVYVTLSYLHADAGRQEEATEAMTRAIEIASSLSSEETRAENLWRYYFLRGAGLVDAGEWDAGEADLRMALDLAPDEPNVLNYLGYSYVERGERLEEAFGMIERALNLRPNSGAITDSLGWAHFQLGRYGEAVRLLEQAVALEPGDDVITDHLGDAYWHAGRRKEAAYEWQRVLLIEDLDPDLRGTVEAKLAGQPPEPGALAEEAREDI